MTPKTLHRVWVGKPMPPELEAIGATWQATHPQWEHRLWTDDDLKWLENRDIYDRAEDIVADHHLGQFRANIARYEIMWRHGGVYVDCDLESLKPLDPLIGRGAWVGWEHEGGKWGPLIGNTILASEPGHPFWRRCIDRVREDVERFAGEPSWKMIGPSMLTRLYQEDTSGLVVYPQRWFYPYPTNNPRLNFGNYGDAYTVHHWAHYRTKRGREIPEPRARWPIRLSVSIMAHPKRAGHVETIRERLDAPAHVEWDNGVSVWETARRAWLSYDPDATHHLVLQDDVLVCHDLVAGLTKAVEQVPTSPISAFMMCYRLKGGRREAYERRVADGRAWYVETSSLSGQAIVLPVADIPEMVAFADADRRADIYDDLRIRGFYRGRKTGVWNTVPSLVEHLDPTDGNASLIPGNDKRPGPRKAIAFIGEDASALDVDWGTDPHFAVMLGEQPVDERMAGFRHAPTGKVRWHPKGSKRAKQLDHDPHWDRIDV